MRQATAGRMHEIGNGQQRQYFIYPVNSTSSFKPLAEASRFSYHQDCSSTQASMLALEV